MTATLSAIATGRPRRSCLYMPASNLRAIEKARSLPCDVVILDLEDAVAPDAKETARAQAVEAVKAGGFGRREVVIRVNGLDTPWGGDDLRAAAEAGPDAVLIPKVGDGADIARYDGRLSHAPEKTRLWAMIETARALFHLHDIAEASKTSRLSAVCLGPNDLAKETGWRMTRTREPFFAAFSLAVAAARSHGLTALDGPFGGLEDIEGLEFECRQGRAFGFDGKTLIHPGQIESANRIYAPDPEELAHARAIIAAFAESENAALGAVRVNGKMAERLHLGEAEKLVALAEAIGG
jgi:citrate lyase subunit beta/citryl-CoA lyase